MLAFLYAKIAYIPKEIWLQGHPQWDNSWTNLGTYTNVAGSLNYVTFEDFPDHELYFEMIGKTDAGTGYWQLYNSTDGEAMANSEIYSSSTDPIRLRSGSIPKPEGAKTIIVQHKIVGGNGTTEYVNSIMSRIVFRLPPL